MIVEVKNKNVFNILLPGVTVVPLKKATQLQIHPLVVKKIGVAEVLMAIYEGIGTEGVVWTEI